jgi:hypothetical protein
MVFGTLTWVGFMIVAFGWALLFSGAPFVDLLASMTGRNLGALSNLPAISECAIVSGFGLAIVGALKTGFGALQKFFDTVLERTARTASSHSRDDSRMSLTSGGRASGSARVEPRAEEASSVIERGRLKDRAYVLFGDGSVEVETLLGLRRFASVGEAYEFIG